MYVFYCWSLVTVNLFTWWRWRCVHAQNINKKMHCSSCCPISLFDIKPLTPAYFFSTYELFYLILSTCDHTPVYNDATDQELLFRLLPLFRCGLFTLLCSHSAAISHPHFLKPRMSEIPHAFHSVYAAEEQGGLRRGGSVDLLMVLRSVLTVWITSLPPSYCLILVLLKKHQAFIFVATTSQRCCRSDFIAWQISAFTALTWCPPPTQ